MYSLDIQTCTTPISLDIQRVLKRPFKVFEDILICRPPIWDLENESELNVGCVPSIIRPYKYPYGQNNEMENIVKAVTGKSTVQALVDRIEHQQEVLQIPMMLENKMKL